MTPAELTPAEVRAALERIVKERHENLSQLSRWCGKNAAYLQQFLERGSPQRLPEDVRLKLAQALNIDERLLGARDPWKPQPNHQLSRHD